jgi:dynein heavy chain
LQAPLLQFKEEIEEITDSADKQLKLELQLNNEIIAYWEIAELQIFPYQNIDVPCVLGGNIQDIMETLDAHIVALN